MLIRLYTALFYLSLPLVFLRILYRSRKNSGYRKHLLERLGIVRFKLDNCILIHAVSFGESKAAIGLINELSTKYPNSKICVTNTTPTGRFLVEKEIDDSIYHCYLPYDLPILINRFFNKVRPKLLILMETEIWPNLNIICQKRSIPIVLANARLSDKSSHGYSRFSKTTAKMLNPINHIAAQYENDANNFKKLGVDSGRVTITGNIKFDMAIDQTIYIQAEKLKAQIIKAKGANNIWIAASTHRGEDEIVLSAHAKILKQFPDALLILVPRHPERFKEVTALAKAKFNTITRSSVNLIKANTKVYIGNTMGELLMLYKTAEVAFVGGSITTQGGHNIIEPAALEVPIITGPNMKNFKQINKLFTQADAKLTATNVESLTDCVVTLFKNPEKRNKLIENGKQIALQNKGALKRLLNCIDEFI